MRKNILFVGLVGLAVVAAFVFFFVSRSDIKKVEGETVTSSVEEKMILLYPERGDVSFKVNQNALYLVATASPTVIPNNAIVHTGIGKASILLPDNSSISLEENTEIAVSYSDNKTSMYQSFGTTYHRVQKLLTGATYEVKTAGTLAAVRGTKFVVSYELKTKKTKIAVTENKVEVSTVTKSPNEVTNPQNEERRLIEAGKMVSVDVRDTLQGGEVSSMRVLDTSQDTDMFMLAEREKKIDSEIDSIKKEFEDNKLNKQEMREKIKQMMSDETNKETKSDTSKKEESAEAVQGVKPKATEIKPAAVETKQTIDPPKPVVAKMGEEEFFTSFEPLFVKYFYLDETDTPCSLRVSPGDRVKIVTDFATAKGYPFVKETLPSFSEAISGYCLTKDKAVKTKLQARFDDEYPF